MKNIRLTESSSILLLLKNHIDFLAKLKQVIIQAKNKTEKAIQIQLDQSTDTSSVTPTNEEICSGATKYYIDNYKKGLYKGLELFDEKLSNKQFEYLKKLNNGLVNCWNMEYSGSNKNLSDNTKKYKANL